jgi:hypothetical protein
MNTMKTQPTITLKELLDAYPLDTFRLLVDMTAINHPAVRIPKRKTLPALLLANPPNDFLRRLAVSNN